VSLCQETQQRPQEAPALRLHTDTFKLSDESGKWKAEREESQESKRKRNKHKEKNQEGKRMKENHNEDKIRTPSRSFQG